MIKRTYHYYAAMFDDRGRVVSYEEGCITRKTWLPSSAEAIIVELRDKIRDNGRDGVSPVIQSLTRIS